MDCLLGVIRRSPNGHTCRCRRSPEKKKNRTATARLLSLQAQQPPGAATTAPVVDGPGKWLHRVMGEAPMLASLRLYLQQYHRLCDLRSERSDSWFDFVARSTCCVVAGERERENKLPLNKQTFQGHQAHTARRTGHTLWRNPCRAGTVSEDSSPYIQRSARGVLLMAGIHSYRS